MLIRRVLTAAVLLPLFLGAMFHLPPRAWAIAMLLPVAAAAFEWGRLTGLGRLGAFAYALFTAAAGLAWLEAGSQAPLAMVAVVLWAVATLFWVVVVPLWLGLSWKPRSRVLGVITGMLVLFPAWLALIMLQPKPWLLLALLGVVWVADSAAYFSGHRWGRRKLAPSISPGKTWEGVAGAVCAVVLYHSVVWHWGLSQVMPEAWLAMALLVAAMVPLSILGDLFESWMKRQAGVKDSGNLLPGHGGILDRIDALTSTLPVAALVFALFNGRLT